MIVRNYTNVGFQCPYCGNVENKRINMFDYSGDTSEIKCGSCRKVVACITKHDRIKYKIDFFCIECGNNHTYKIPISEFWHTKFKELNCLQVNESVFAIGKEENIAQMLNESFCDIEDESDELLFNEDDFLFNIEEMFDDFYIPSKDNLMMIVNHFENLSKTGMVSCSCGEKYLSMQLDEEGILIFCPKCMNEMIFDISNLDAVERILNLTEIKLD